MLKKYNKIYFKIMSKAQFCDDEENEELTPLERILFFGKFLNKYDFVYNKKPLDYQRLFIKISPLKQDIFLFQKVHQQVSKNHY